MVKYGMIKIIFPATIVILLLLIFIASTQLHDSVSVNNQNKRSNNPGITIVQDISPTPAYIPPVKVLNNNYHIFQTFNNCGPASLSMLLSYFGINKSQQELAAELRPYNNPEGINDDKSVTLDEIAEKAQEFGLLAYHRPAGTMDLLKQFIAADIPVLTRTWLHLNEDIGHYRVVKGYDDSTREIIQDDSYENKDLRYSYDDFNELWKKFNYEYLIIAPKENQQFIENILGENLYQQKAWENATRLSVQELQKNPDDIYARFNLSVAYHNIRDYHRSVVEFEKVENQLPFRTLWYQLEPVDSYYQTGNYERVYELTDKILSNQNKAYSEVYLLRGQSYIMQGNFDLAQEEFDKAVLYNKNFSSKIPQL